MYSSRFCCFTFPSSSFECQLRHISIGSGDRQPTLDSSVGLELQTVIVCSLIWRSPVQLRVEGFFGIFFAIFSLGVSALLWEVPRRRGRAREAACASSGRKISFLSRSILFSHSLCSRGAVISRGRTSAGAEVMEIALSIQAER